MHDQTAITKSIIEAKYHILLAFCIFTIDRLFKWYALHSLPNEGVFWIPGILGLERYKNTGIAFSLPVDRVITLIATLVVVIGLVQNILRHYPSKRMLAALAFLTFGAASNFFDRLAYGYVVDYLRLGPLSLVNAADVMVVAGVILIISDYKKVRAKDKATRDEQNHSHETPHQTGKDS